MTVSYRRSVDEPVRLLLTLEHNAVSLPPLFGCSEDGKETALSMCVCAWMCVLQGDADGAST